MKLLTSDRLNLGATLPTEGDWMTLTTARDIAKKINITKEELDAIGFNHETGQYTPSKDKEKDFTFNALETKVIKDVLTKKEKDGKLQSVLMSLYEKFVLG